MSNKKIDIEEQIIKKSFNLFLVNGYEKTTIENILESMKLLDSLYVSTEKRKEFEL